MLISTTRLFLFALLGCTACASAAQDPAAAATTLYLCDGGTGFNVREAGSSALVRFSDGEYRLARRQSSIGRKFASPRATLIIDGSSAVFVAEDRLDLDGCHAADSA